MLTYTLKSGGSSRFVALQIDRAILSRTEWSEHQSLDVRPSMSWVASQVGHLRCGVGATSSSQDLYVAPARFRTSFKRMNKQRFCDNKPEA